MTSNNDELKNFLLEAGLSKKEATVYISLLDLGHGSVSQIARQASINRTTGYDILSSLVEKGLVAISGKNPKQQYVAEHPEKVIDYLNHRADNIARALQSAKIHVPLLESIHTKGDRPKVIFYEGTNGLEKAYEDTLTSHEEIRGYATVDDMHKGLPNYFPNYYKRRAEAGISIRAIIPKTEVGLERSSHDVEEKRDSAFVPADKFYFSPEINIYDNKVMIASWREKLGIIIESAEIADAMKKIFELSWAEAKRLDKENK